MTLHRVREIFGDKVEDCTDEDLTLFITNTSILCDELLKVTTGCLTRYEAVDNLNGR